MVKNLLLFVLPLLYLINITSGLKCYQCDSSKDINCSNDLKKFTPMECKDDENICVTMLSKGIITRDCSKDDGLCLGNTCKDCNQDGCNTNIACFECDAAINSNCTTNYKILPVVCPNGKDKCITQVKEDKNIERKCVSETVVCDENKAKTCDICDKALCNKETFPKDRRLCYQCTKDDEDCGTLKTTKTTLCKLYDENEKCYTFGTSETDMNRGCMSDIDHKCSGETCVTCDTQSCNNQPFSRKPTRKCFQCGASETKCVKDPYVCKKPVAYWMQKEECFTQTIKGKTARGCVNDREANDVSCTEENSCKICEKDGCNTGASLVSTSIILSFAIVVLSVFFMN